MTEDLEHLLPECRADALLSPQERIELVKVDRWVTYARADIVLGHLRSLLHYQLHDRMPCMLLYGLPGMGKTKILQKFLRDHPSSFDEVKGVSRINVIGVQMPPDADEKSLYEEILGALDARIHYGHNTSQMRRTARDLMTFVDARMLIIDELHALLGGSYRQQRILLNAIRFLANDLKLTLVCAGTADAKRTLATDRQLADRFRAIELPAWDDDDSYHRFLMSFATVLPLQRKSDLLFTPLRRSILQHSEGVLVRIVGILKELAIEAIQSGRERIDRQSLPSLPSLAPLISMQANIEPSRPAL